MYYLTVSKEGISISTFVELAGLIGAVILPTAQDQSQRSHQPAWKDSWISRANSRRQPWITTRNSHVSRVQEMLERDNVFSNPFLTLFGLPWLWFRKLPGENCQNSILAPKPLKSFRFLTKFKFRNTSSKCWHIRFFDACPEYLAGLKFCLSYPRS